MSVTKIKDIKEKSLPSRWKFTHDLYYEVDSFDSDAILKYFSLDWLPDDRGELLVDDKKLMKCSEVEVRMYCAFMQEACSNRMIWYSTTKLAERFNISRATAHRAMKNLEDQDLIVKLWTSSLGSCYLVKQ